MQHLILNLCSSFSLEILETDNALAKKKLDKENIKANSNLLESVFQDFNIDIQVVNVTSAFKLSEEQEKTLIEVLRKIVNTSEIKLVTDIDKS